MSVHDADLDDLYVNEAGHAYRVVATCDEPTVHMESLEGKTRIAGGVSGYMWHGFKRVWRKPKPNDATDGEGA